MEIVSFTNRSTYRRPAAAIALVGALLLASVGPLVSRANAQASPSDSTGSQVTDFVEALSVAQFDGSLGELALAELTASGQFRSRLVELTNDSGEATDFTVSSMVAMCLQNVALSGGTYLGCVNASGPTQVMFDSQVLQEAYADVPVGDTRSSDNVAQSADSQVVVVNDSAALAPFIGGGSIDFLASTLTEFTASGGGGNQTVIIETFADVALAVRYEYAKVAIDAVTNGVDGAEVAPGSTVTWKYTVTNTGTTDLVNLVVTDDVLGPVCTISALAPGAMDMCVRTGIAGSDPYINNAAVVADAAKNTGVQVDAVDPSSYGVPAPTAVPTTGPTAAPTSTVPTAVPTAGPVPTTPPIGTYEPATIDIELATNDIDADVGDGPTYNPGDAITWTYKVINTGTVDLTNVQVSDDLAGAVCAQPLLAVANSFTCTLTGTSCAGQQARVSSVVGLATTGVTVRDSDPTHHNCAASPGPGGPDTTDQVLGKVVSPPNEPLAYTGSNADGPVKLALVLSLFGILAIVGSEVLRMRRTTARVASNELYAGAPWKLN